jgi:epoxyqueuosine reductase QueG
VKEKTGGQVKLCGICFNTCPAGKVVHKTLAVGKWTTLNDLKTEGRRKLVTQFTKNL